MKRKELIVLLVVICVLVAVNTVNFLRKERLKKSYSLVIEDGRIQLSLNSVSAIELEDLPGVGPVLAERIVEYREQNEGFRSLEELKRVKGIGDKLYQKIFPFVKL
jgi:competence ComEA-like helix-hairpin-helix protein